VVNVLRPVVAVGRYIGFAAMALHQNPDWRARFASGDLALLEPFAEEVRRLYPFFPAVGGRACRRFEWRGHAFAPGDWVVLDLHGTNHDPALHPEPQAFRPERGLSWRDQGFAFVPQGAGDTHRTHRCPGEAVTVAITAEAVRLLCQELSWEMPPQDLGIDLARIPARPASGVLLARLRSAEPRSGPG
jgi:fatty-acid peroxygenase